MTEDLALKRPTGSLLSPACSAGLIPCPSFVCGEWLGTKRGVQDRVPSSTCPAFCLLLLCVVLVGGCQSAYYNALEEFGYHKRDLLVSRVESAQESQTAAKEQFQSALDAFRSLTHFEGGELESRYETLNSEYEASVAKAQQVSERIDAVEDVAEALFDEWSAELDQYTSEQLRADSERQLEATQARYEQLMFAMRRAEQTMEPVLAAFQDQVLALKHNLNAQAIASLRNERATVEADVSALIEEMEAAIREAETFLATVNGASR
jgi:DUF2959 family protein